MDIIASLFSALKAEIESLITVVVGSGGETADSSDSQQAANNSDHGSDSAPNAYSAPSLTDQQADSSTSDRSGTQHATGDAVFNPSGDAQVADVATGLPANLPPSDDSLIDTAGQHQIAQDSDTQNTGIDPQLADAATHSPLLLNPDFLIDTIDHSGPAPSQSDMSGPSGIAASAAAPANQDFDLTLSGNDIHSAISSALLDAGEFALASVAQQGYSFAQGSGGTSGPNTGGSYSGVSITSDNGGTTPFVVTLFLDNSLQSLSSTNPSEYAAITNDLQTVANFFATHLTNNPNDLTHPQHSFLMNVGWGEGGGAALSSGAIGGSQYNEYAVPYSSLQQAFGNMVAAETASGSQTVNIPAQVPFSSSNPQFMVTAAETHALNIKISGGTQYGSVGFSSAANTFFFDPTHPVAGQYDFMGIVAHEMSEVFGRVTLNGAKSGNYKELTPLDLFHFADSNGAPTFSGTTAGHFALSQYSSPGVLSTPIAEFNNVSANGDFGDWTANTADAFSSSPAKGVALPFSYADYLAMEAAGYSGNFSGTADAWNSGIAPTI